MPVSAAGSQSHRLWNCHGHYVNLPKWMCPPPPRQNSIFLTPTVGPFDLASNRWAPQLLNVAAAAFKSNEYLLKHCSKAEAMAKAKAKAQRSPKRWNRERRGHCGSTRLCLNKLMINSPSRWLCNEQKANEPGKRAANESAKGKAGKSKGLGNSTSAFFPPFAELYKKKKLLS